MLRMGLIWDERSGLHGNDSRERVYNVETYIHFTLSL